MSELKRSLSGVSCRRCPLGRLTFGVQNALGPKMASLLPPRRLVVSHKPSGKPEVSDDTPLSIPIPGGMTFTLAYIHKGMPADPADAMAGTTAQPDDGWFRVMVAWQGSAVG